MCGIPGIVNGYTRELDPKILNKVFSASRRILNER